MDDRDRASPIALSRHPPIAQAIGDRALAAPQRLEPFGGFPLGLGNRQPVEEIGVAEGAVFDIGLIADREMRRVLTRRQYHRDHRQPVFAGEFEVALVVRRAAENGAGAVFHQHKVGDPDRHAPVGVKRMHGFEAGGAAALLGGLDYRLAGAHAVAFGDEGGQLGIGLGQKLRQRVVRRQGHERGAEQGVLPGGEDLDGLAPPGDLEKHPGAFRAADPVLLHQPNALRPALEAAERVEQFLGEFGDAQKPLR